MSEQQVLAIIQENSELVKLLTIIEELDLAEGCLCAGQSEIPSGIS